MQGLHLVAKALRELPALSSVTFTELSGRGTAGSTVVVGPTAGMTGKEQAQVVEAFRKSGGRKVVPYNLHIRFFAIIDCYKPKNPCFSLFIYL